MSSNGQDRGRVAESLGLGVLLRQKVHELLAPNSKIIDIGGGSGWHSIYFADKGHKVLYNDLFQPAIEHDNIDFAIHDIMQNGLFRGRRYDCAFISHVLEHQLNITAFLQVVSHWVDEGGLIAICVPPAKGQIVSGHMTIWNAGLVLYNLVAAGLDCSKAKIFQHGYNISVIIRKELISLPSLSYDYGDLTKLRQFFPEELEWTGDSFNGNLTELNWG